MDLLITLSIAVLLIPVFSFVVLIFFGKRLPRQGDWFGTGLLFINLLLSIYIFYAFVINHNQSFTFDWFNLGPSSKFSAGIVIDHLSAMMLVIVNLISALVHLFSVKYMEGDTKYSRYFAFLGLFTFSMLGIVLTNNLLLMYVFWELVGVSSYLLIGFWYEKKAPQEAAKKAFIVNRVGDVGFFTGIMIVFTFLGTFQFTDIFAGVEAGKLSGAWLTAAGILLFCGAVGKSAQFPLHVWLPDAMEGPTPVSALIHAATMVAAGVYMVARIFVLFSADALTVIAYTGALTAFIAATVAITQNDIKKVLAYSTVSQLGYMIMALGISAYSYAMFHLMTHAFFKACLFLGAGSVIYGMHHEQDIQNMGGLRKKMPITYLTFLISTIAISGVPFTSGFLSKDSILAASLAFAHNNGGINYIIPITAFGVAGLTAFYMFRLVILTFFGNPRNQEKYDHCQESPWQMTFPLILLSVLSVFFFYSFNPINAESGWVMEVIKQPEQILKGTVGKLTQILPLEELKESFHHAHYSAMFLSLLLSGFGILMAYTFYYWKKINADKVAEKIKPLYKFSLNKWYFDELYDKTVIAFTMIFAKFLRWFDNTIVDGVVNGSAYITKITSFFSGKFDNFVVDTIVNLAGAIAAVFGWFFRKLQTGKIQTYIAFLIFGMLILYFVFKVII
jgi:NADH-quinone oxidoreductase subunit L